MNKYENPIELNECKKPGDIIYFSYKTNFLKNYKGILLDDNLESTEVTNTIGFVAPMNPKTGEVFKEKCVEVSKLIFADTLVALKDLQHDLLISKPQYKRSKK